MVGAQAGDLGESVGVGGPVGAGQADEHLGGRGRGQRVKRDGDDGRERRHPVTAGHQDERGGSGRKQRPDLTGPRGVVEEYQGLPLGEQLVALAEEFLAFYGDPGGRDAELPQQRGGCGLGAGVVLGARVGAESKHMNAVREVALQAIGCGGGKSSFSASGQAADGDHRPALLRGTEIVAPARPLAPGSGGDMRQLGLSAEQFGDGQQALGPLPGPLALGRGSGRPSEGDRRCGRAGDKGGDVGAVEDEIVEGPEAFAGSGTEVVVESMTDVPVDSEGLGNAAAAVEGRHQMGGDLLVPRVLVGEFGQGGDEVGVPAEAQFDFGAGQLGGEPLVLHDLAGLLGPLARQAGKRVALPEVVGIVEGVEGPPVVARFDETAGLAGPTAIGVPVDLVGFGAEGVGAGAGDDLDRALAGFGVEFGGVAECRPQSGDVDLQGADGTWRGLSVPEAFGEDGGGDRTFQIHGQGGQQDSDLPRTDRQRPSACRQFDCSQQVQIHLGASCRRFLGRAGGEHGTGGGMLL